MIQRIKQTLLRRLLKSIKVSPTANPGGNRHFIQEGDTTLYIRS